MSTAYNVHIFMNQVARCKGTKYTWIHIEESK